MNSLCCKLPSIFDIAKPEQGVFVHLKGKRGWERSIFWNYKITDLVIGISRCSNAAAQDSEHSTGMQLTKCDCTSGIPWCPLSFVSTLQTYCLFIQTFFLSLWNTSLLKKIQHRTPNRMSLSEVFDTSTFPRKKLLLSWECLVFWEGYIPLPCLLHSCGLFPWGRKVMVLRSPSELLLYTGWIYSLSRFPSRYTMNLGSLIRSEPFSILDGPAKARVLRTLKSWYWPDFCLLQAEKANLSESEWLARSQGFSNAELWEQCVFLFINPLRNSASRPGIANPVPRGIVEPAEHFAGVPLGRCPSLWACFLLF